MANKSNTKQITLHFNGDNTEILDIFKARAKQNFRTTEQEILFELNGLIRLFPTTTDEVKPTKSVMTEEERSIYYDLAKEASTFEHENN